MPGHAAQAPAGLKLLFWAVGCLSCKHQPTNAGWQQCLTCTLSQQHSLTIIVCQASSCVVAGITALAGSNRMFVQPLRHCSKFL